MAFTTYMFESFDSGTTGADVTTANTSFSKVQGPGATFVAGLVGAHACDLTSVGATSVYVRDSGFSQSKLVFRWNLKITSYPTALNTHAHAYQGDSSTGTKLGDIVIDTTGHLKLRDFATVVATATTALALNTAYSIEWMIDLDTNIQTLRLYDSLNLTGVTPLYTLTGAITTTVPASNGGATLINQIQIGKMNGLAGFNHIIDSYLRADNWVALNLAAVENYFFCGLNGTGGSNVLIGDDASFNYVSPTPPVWFDDGVDITPNQCIQMAGASGTVERCVSTYMNLNPPTSYERFYFKIVTPPAAGQIFTIWRAESNDRATYTCALKVTPWQTGLYKLAIYDQTDTEVDAFTGIKEGEWMRIEDDMIEDDGGGTGVTFRIFTGNNTHGPSSNPSQSAFHLFPNINKRRRTLQRSIRNTGSNDPSFRFDSWKCHPTTAPGPVSDPDIPDPIAQYRFTEWNGTSEINLTPKYWDGAIESTEAASFDIGSTVVQGDPPSGGSRFPGDPGLKKLYLGWCTEGNTWSTHYGELARLRAASTTGYPANPNIKEGIYRTFETFGNEVWGAHADATWTEHRQAAANCSVVFMNLEVEVALGTLPDGVWTKAKRICEGYYDSYLSTMANKFKDIYTRYGAYVWMSMSNEPDAWSNSQVAHFPEAMYWLRKCARYMHFYMEAAGVVNFQVTSPTTFNQTGTEHQARHARALLTTGEITNVANRIDTIYQYHPDWKGTRTGWTDAWSPEATDFISDGQSDAYGTGPVTKLWGGNTYCPSIYAQPGIFEMTYSAMTTTHIPSNTSHWGNFQRFFKGLYGQTLPVAIGEWGYPIWQSMDVSDPVKTADFYTNTIIDSMLNMEFVGALVWRQELDSSRSQATTTSWLPIGFRADYDDYVYWNNNGRSNVDQVAEPNKWLLSANDDPVYFAGTNNAKRRGLAAMWTRPEVVNPGPGKPLSPQHG